MFFFFPFTTELAAAPASRKPPLFKPLPLLPAPKSAVEDSLGGAVSQAAQVAVDFLKQALSSLTSSMTALGNRANALFAQVAAALAFDRLARDTASFFGMFWPGLAKSWPRSGFAGPLIAPTPEFSLYPSFGFPSFSGNPRAGNPWALFTESAAMWTSFLVPATSPRRSSYYAPAPVTTTFALPGCTWNVTFG